MKSNNFKKTKQIIINILIIIFAIATIVSLSGLNYLVPVAPANNGVVAPK